MCRNKLKALLALIVMAGLCSSAYAASATYDVAASGDDTYAQIGDGATDANQVTTGAVAFGRHQNATPENHDQWAYIRFTPAIPRASNMTAANLSFYSGYARSGSFNTTIYGLQRDGDWDDSDGFDTTDYSNGTALRGIGTTSTTVTWSSVASWSARAWYDSPDISAILQVQVDTLGGSEEFDPLDSTNKYLGYMIDDGDGSYVVGPVTQARRIFEPHDDDPALAVELDVTFTAWGELRTGNGMKYDSAYGCYRYFDY